MKALLIYSLTLLCALSHGETVETTFASPPVSGSARSFLDYFNPGRSPGFKYKVHRLAERDFKESNPPGPDSMSWKDQQEVGAAVFKSLDANLDSFFSSIPPPTTDEKLELLEIPYRYFSRGQLHEGQFFPSGEYGRRYLRHASQRCLRTAASADEFTRLAGFRVLGASEWESLHDAEVLDALPKALATFEFAPGQIENLIQRWWSKEKVQPVLEVLKAPPEERGNLAVAALVQGKPDQVLVPYLSELVARGTTARGSKEDLTRLKARFASAFPPRKKTGLRAREVGPGVYQLSFTPGCSGLWRVVSGLKYFWID